MISLSMLKSLITIGDNIEHKPPSQYLVEYFDLPVGTYLRTKLLCFAHCRLLVKTFNFLICFHKFSFHSRNLGEFLNGLYSASL